MKFPWSRRKVKKIITTFAKIRDEMKEARESVLAVVPFTVGVAAVRFPSLWFNAHYSLMLTVLAVCLAGMIPCAAAAVLAVSLPGRIAATGGRKGSFPAETDAATGGRKGAFHAGTDGVTAGRIAAALLFLLAGAAAGLLAGLPAGTESAGGLATGGAGWPGRFASECGARFRAMIDGIPYRGEMTGPLVKALLAGDRSGLSREVRGAFRAAGASHLLALSGLHLSVIYLIFSKLLSVAGNSPAVSKARSVLIILGSGFFTLMTGASPSLVRAFLFITLRELALIFRRRVSSLHIFLMSLMIQLALNPADIVSVGFQLSYLAMLGIYILYPPLEGLWDRAGAWRIGRKEENGTPQTHGGHDEEGRGQAFGAAMRRIWSLCALSISCQVFTAPAVLLYFGTFPRYFLITNLFCLPISNVLITVSVITTVLAPLGLCPGFLLWVNDFLVSLLIRILETIAEL